VNISDISPDRLLRLGFGVGALAAVLAALAGFGALAEGPDRTAPFVRTARLDVEPVVAIIALVALAVILVAAFVPRTWLWPVGVLATTAVATSSGIEVVRGRIADAFAPDVSTSLQTGGVLLVIAFWVAIVAIALQLFALRRFAQERPVEPDEVLDQVPMRPDGRPLRTSMKGTLGVALGIAGVIAPVFSATAVALSLGALGDIRAYDGRMGGRGTAMTGVVLGIIGLSLLIAVLGFGGLFLKPTGD
jgi:hypothetical protein